jgi:mannose-6-phosphate isomerase-like protein (cupin superfamily)
MRCSSSTRAARPTPSASFEAGAGDILVIKAGEVHSFRVVGDGALVATDVHVSPRFIQENLG